MVPKPTKTAKSVTCLPCKSSIGFSMRRLALPLLPSIPAALLKLVYLGITFPCSGLSSHHFKSTLPKAMYLKTKQEKDLHRSCVIQVFQNLVSTGVGTVPPPRLKTSCQKKPVMQRRHASYGRSVRSSLDWLKWTGKGVAYFPIQVKRCIYEITRVLYQNTFGICCRLISPT